MLYTWLLTLSFPHFCITYPPTTARKMVYSLLSCRNCVRQHFSLLFQAISSISREWASPSIKRINTKATDQRTRQVPTNIGNHRSWINKWITTAVSRIPIKLIWQKSIITLENQLSMILVPLKMVWIRDAFYRNGFNFKTCVKVVLINQVIAI